MQRFLVYFRAVMRHFHALLIAFSGSLIVSIPGWIPFFLTPEQAKTFTSIISVSPNTAWWLAGLVFLCGFFYASFLAWNEEVEELNRRKLEVVRLEAEKASLEDRPEVIFSGKTQGPLITWEIVNKKTTAFNIKSDIIRCGQISAVLQPIKQLDPGEKITPIFLIFDERYERHQKQLGDPSPYLQVILESGNYILTLRYINASGRQFQSETEIVWDDDQNRVETWHKQIVAIIDA